MDGSGWQVRQFALCLSGIGWATSSRLGQPPARVLVAWPVRVSACAVPKGLMGSIWYRSSLERSACVPSERRAWRVVVRCRAGRDPLRIIAERPREVITQWQLWSSKCDEEGR